MPLSILMPQTLLLVAPPPRLPPSDLMMPPQVGDSSLSSFKLDESTVPGARLTQTKQGMGRAIERLGRH